MEGAQLPPFATITYVGAVSSWLACILSTAPEGTQIERPLARALYLLQATLEVTVPRCLSVCPSWLRAHSLPNRWLTVLCSPITVP